LHKKKINNKQEKYIAMTFNYKKWNNIIGWLVFAIATLVFVLTLEPTTSWWDAGEYIATAYKLEVGHPPGAPFFQLMGRFFSLFAFGNTANVAYMINLMSGLSSSFTILFLFWTITRFAKKLVGEEMTDGKAWAVYASAAVGALAFTFSDSFWFSAVEGEVYAMSSLFTAVVFWAILKWEEVSDTPYANRWLIFIAYMIGLSIGVHLLNLLAIPAIAYVVYFKKYKKVDAKGFIIAGLAGFLILSFIMYLIIPTTVRLAGSFELFFTNTVGLPFDFGSYIFIISLAAAIAWAWMFTYKRRYQIAHVAVISLTFLMIGYSSFFMLVIRANANPPINENDPKDAISLLSYLLREQYGSWPLGYGQYYNANITDWKDGWPIYVKDEKAGKYIITDDRKGSEPIYNPELSTIFPRMWSNQKPSHIRVYEAYKNSRGSAVRIQGPEGEKIEYKPTFGDNLGFFFKYQLGHSYFRYFMWNFVGRQNDIEAGQPTLREGNWISGIKFIDAMRLGNQDELPIAAQNPARNTFYFLPLILGIIGVVFHFNKNIKDFWVVLLLFVMTGIAIIVYLNVTPYQPRERDYAYAGSYYAFAIWMGLGVLALIQSLSKKINMKIATVGVFIVTLVAVPGIMATEGWDDHDRSGKTTARDFAINYLESCEPNAILFVNGDNDTFPLWYAQEVEGIRTDIRVVNFMLSSGPWYIHQLQRKIYNSEKIPLSLRPEQYNKGINSYLPVYTRVEGDIELKRIIDFIKDDDKSTKLETQRGKFMNYIPTRNVKLTLDSTELVNRGIVPIEKAEKIPDEISWKLGGNNIIKNELMLLDLIATNNWDRPIYFANPSSVKKVLPLDEYMHLEGFVYHLLPYKAEGYINGMGGVNADKAYDLLVNKANWGNLNDPDVSIDRESARNSGIPKNNFLRVAESMITKGEKEKAVKALDTYIENYPHEVVNYDMFMIPYIEAYYKAGAVDKANEMSQVLYDFYISELNYINSLDPERKKLLSQDQQSALGVLQRLGQITRQNSQIDLSQKIDSTFKEQINFY
jgi:hypothetical protein